MFTRLILRNQRECVQSNGVHRESLNLHVSFILKSVPCTFYKSVLIPDLVTSKDPCMQTYQPRALNWWRCARSKCGNHGDLMVWYYWCKEWASEQDHILLKHWCLEWIAMYDAVIQWCTKYIGSIYIENMFYLLHSNILKSRDNRTFNTIYESLIHRS